MFYDRFIYLCKKRGIKPTPLVMQMGLSSSNVSQWKKGSTPRPEVLTRLADYFDVSVEYLLESDQKEKPATLESDGLEEAIILGRNGKKIKRTYTKEQMDALRKIIDVMPFVNDEDI